MLENPSRMRSEEEKIIAGKILANMSSAQHWLEYINYLEGNHLSEAKEGALQEAVNNINENENKDNRNYIILHLKIAKSKKNPMDILDHFQYMWEKEIGKRYSSMFLDWADAALKANVIDVAVSAINKGISCGAEPRQSLLVRLQELKPKEKKNKRIHYDDGEVEFKVSKVKIKDDRQLRPMNMTTNTTTNSLPDDECTVAVPIIPPPSHAITGAGAEVSTRRRHKATTTTATATTASLPITSSTTITTSSSAPSSHDGIVRSPSPPLIRTLDTSHILLDTDGSDQNMSIAMVDVPGTATVTTTAAISTTASTVRSGRKLQRAFQPSGTLGKSLRVPTSGSTSGSVSMSNPSLSSSVTQDVTVTVTVMGDVTAQTQTQPPLSLSTAETKVRKDKTTTSKTLYEDNKRSNVRLPTPSPPAPLQLPSSSLSHIQYCQDNVIDNDEGVDDNGHVNVNGNVNGNGRSGKRRSESSLSSALTDSSQSISRQLLPMSSSASLSSSSGSGSVLNVSREVTENGLLPEKPYVASVPATTTSSSSPSLKKKRVSFSKSTSAAAASSNLALIDSCGNGNGNDKEKCDKVKDKVRSSKDGKKRRTPDKTNNSSNISSNREVITINGKRYLRLDALGKGASSVVYRVFCEDDEKIYAYKRVDIRGGCVGGGGEGGEDGDGDKAVDVFTTYANEIELLRKLSGCPYIVEVKDAIVNREEMYVAMVMEAGDIDLAHTLHQQRRAGSVIDPFFLRTTWKQMLQAVDYMHEQRVVHGDLKPANFVFVRGRLKLIDFGIAKALSNDTTNITRENTVGTVNYMAPEAICPMDESGSWKVKLGRASDIWSMGCILYQMVYGQAPFAGTANIMQRMHLITNPKVAIDFPALLLNDMHAIESIQLCLQRNPCKRPSIAMLLSHSFLSLPTVSIVKKREEDEKNVDKTELTAVDKSNNHNNDNNNRNDDKHVQTVRRSTCVIATQTDVPTTTGTGGDDGDAGGSSVPAVAMNVHSSVDSSSQLQQQQQQQLYPSLSQINSVIRVLLDQGRIRGSRDNISEHDISKEVIKMMIPSSDDSKQISYRCNSSCNSETADKENISSNESNINRSNTNTKTMKDKMLSELGSGLGRGSTSKTLRGNSIKDSTVQSTATTLTAAAAAAVTSQQRIAQGSHSQRVPVPVRELPPNLRSEIRDSKARMSAVHGSNDTRAQRWMRPKGTSPEKVDLRSELEKRMCEMRKFLQHDDAEEGTLQDFSFQN
eukprot:gene10123-21105_t